MLTFALHMHITHTLVHNQTLTHKREGGERGGGGLKTSLSDWAQQRSNAPSFPSVWQWGGWLTKGPRVSFWRSYYLYYGSMENIYRQRHRNSTISV